MIPEEIKTLQDDSIVHWLTFSGGSRLPVRHWRNGEQKGKEKVILLHGGSGSWLHWIRNIPVLKKDFDVYAMDLPGLGDADMCALPSDAVSSADAVATAMESLFDGEFHIVAFSWGCTMTAMVMKRLERQLASVMLTGPAAVGDLPRRQQMKPLIKRTPEMSRDEVMATQRENLSRLMIHDPDRIDELAVEIQELNTTRARFSSPQYARSTLLIDGVRGTQTPLYVVYGEYDAPAYPEVEARHQVFLQARPDVRFDIVPDAGHWLQYEKPLEFNAMCRGWILENTAAPQ